MGKRDEADQVSDLETQIKEVEWRALIRRAFDVPEIVGDTSATTHIAWQLNAKVVGSDRPDVLSPIAGDFLDAFIIKAARGEMDGFLINLPDRNENQLAMDFAQSSGASADVSMQLLTFVTDRVREYLKISGAK